MRIDLKDGHVAFLRVLKNMQIAAYDFCAASDAPIQVDDVCASPVCFITTASKLALTSSEWLVVDIRPLEERLLRPVVYSVWNTAYKTYSVYYSHTGELQPSDQEGCRGLEPAAVWDAHHIEDRLRDHFAGRSNIWLKTLGRQDD